MKCKKSIYPYDDNNICLVISGINMDYAFDNSESGSFTLKSSCIVSPNIRCIKEKTECFLNKNEMIYAIYSLDFLKKWNMQSKEIICLSSDKNSVLWLTDYLLDGKNNPQVIKSKNVSEIFSYFINKKGVIPFFMKEVKVVDNVIMKMEDIKYGLYNDYEYISDFYNNEEESISLSLNDNNFLKRIEKNYKDIISSIKK